MGHRRRPGGVRSQQGKEEYFLERNIANNPNCLPARAWLFPQVTRGAGTVELISPPASTREASLMT